MTTLKSRRGDLLVSPARLPSRDIVAVTPPTTPRSLSIGQADVSQFEPLLVPTRVAKELVGVRNTKFWSLVKSGKIQMAETGGRRMVVYASLKALAQPSA